MDAKEAAERAAVCAEARSWVGTAYHHEARIKARRDPLGRIVDPGGTDCAQIIYCVFRALDLIPEIDIEHYPPDWHLHRSGERYLRYLLQYGRETETPEPGDVVAYRWGRAYAHGAIIVEPGWPEIVHALADARCVLPGRGEDGRLAGRPRIFVTFW